MNWYARFLGALRHHRLARRLLLAALLILCACGGPRPQRPVADPSTLPFTGYVDFPKPGTVVTGKLRVAGWAQWGEQVERVNVYVDRQPVGAPTMGLPRPDAANAFPQYGNANAGFDGSFDVSNYPAGQHMVTVEAVSRKGSLRVMKSFSMEFR